jgi:DNA-3-methyladenine glycosylase
MKLKILSLDFFHRDSRKVAEDLLGKIIVRNYMGYKLTGRIVETEAYVGRIDKASHAYNYKKTPRTEPLFISAGIAYVYKIYGMYSCMNIVTGCEGYSQGVLVRVIEPIEGIEVMSKNRLYILKGLALITLKKQKIFFGGTTLKVINTSQL